MSAAGTDSPIKKKRTTELVLLDVLTFWHGNLPTSDIAKKLHVTAAALQDFARRNKLPRRDHVPRKKPAPMIDPTPEEIAERAAEIRARRTDSENNRLNNYRIERVEIRQYSYSSRTGIFTEM